MKSIILLKWENDRVSFIFCEIAIFNSGMEWKMRTFYYVNGAISDILSILKIDLNWTIS